MKRMIAVLTGLMLASAAHAAELTLISGGAVEPGVHAAGEKLLVHGKEYLCEIGRAHV